MATLQLGPATAMRDVFGQKLLELSKTDPRVYALDGDLGTSTKLDVVEKGNPEKFLQMGIAEQNMIGVAAGMATVGLQPWVCSFATFIVKRALDQIFVTVAQPRLDVKLIGAYSGLLTGLTGKTHQGLEDLAIMRTIPYMVVLAPADAADVCKVMEFANRYEGPVYIRLARDPLPNLFDERTHTFELGKAVQIRDGRDVTLIATGTQTVRSVEAVKRLEERGIDVRLLHMPSIKPIDVESIVAAAEQTGAIVTAEEHTIYGGLGSAVAEVLAEHCPVPMLRVGVKDRNSESGPNDALLKKYEIDMDHIVQAVETMARRKGSLR
ncbi:MAG: transketolase [Paenibacillaceae bacterium ZCTH02-B3]|nr:MAG: transketolase [Paenibacillaceae bacterium ZCTH02-B3]